MSGTSAIIPARFAATRFPGKLLRDLCGKPVLQWAWEAANEASEIDEVIIAAADEKIAEAAERFGARVAMTDADHSSGTDRIAEVITKTYPSDRPEFVVNIQGDEPLLTPGILDAFLRNFISSGHKLGTIIAEANDHEAADPNTVKVVCRSDGTALYFSRGAIPGGLGEAVPRRCKHVGIYAFKTHALLEFQRLPSTPLEKAERLEQLRALENGWDIACAEIPEASALIGVDTEEDLRAVEKAMARRNRPSG